MTLISNCWIANAAPVSIIRNTVDGQLTQSQDAHAIGQQIILGYKNRMDTNKQDRPDKDISHDPRG